MASFYADRTDGELVDLARRGDRRARAMLFDRTISPTSAVALHLLGDRETAIAALTTAYRLAFRRLHRLEEPEQFLPWLLHLVDSRAPFPIGPAIRAHPLTPADRERVRRAVGVSGLPASRTRLPATVAAALLVVLALVGIGSGRPGVEISDQPSESGTATTTERMPAAATPTPSDATSPTDGATVAPTDATVAPTDGPTTDGPTTDGPTTAPASEPAADASDEPTDAGLADTR